MKVDFRLRARDIRFVVFAPRRAQRFSLPHAVCPPGRSGTMAAGRLG